jgi:ribosomal protein S18 acetylase RimI-like enzyme
MKAEYWLREIDPGNDAEIALVAERMRATLMEVLGADRGVAMYTMSWLDNRVREHLDPARTTGAVFLAISPSNEISGHTIVRREHEDDGRLIGLFSTTYVHPSHRRGAVASMLLQEGEAWMEARELPFAVTYTDDQNEPLIALYRKHGYRIVDAQSDMVKIEKPLGLRTSAVG